MASYSPRFAPHVSASFEELRDAEGKPEPIWIELACSACGDRSRVRCHEGAPRSKVAAYAVNHVHRDPMAVPDGENR